MRLMYWPNEPDTSDPMSRQTGPRRLFQAQRDKGELEDLCISSYRVRRLRLGSEQEFTREALALIEHHRSEVLFVSHPGGSGVGPKSWDAIRRAFPNLTIVYHEGDDYHPIAKPLTAEMKGLLKICDLVLLCGLGVLRDLFAKHTKAPIKYSPTYFDKDRFTKLDPARAEKKYSVVSIGNKTNIFGTNFLFFPGGKRRYEMIRRLNRIYGESFSVFGSGWGSLPSARGRITYSQQEEANQSGRISVGWSNFDRTPYCFSGRLAIALASGVPHVSSWQPGLDHMFADCPGLYLCREIPELLDCCEWLLSRSDDELLAEGLAARQWACSNLEADPVFTRAIEMSREALLARRSAGSAVSQPLSIRADG